MILTYLIEFNSNDWPQKLLKKIPKFNFKNLEKLRIMSNEWNQFYSDFSNNSHTFYSNISRHFITENGQQQKKILFELKYKINFSTFVWKRVRSGLYCIGPSRERDDRQRRIGSGSPVSGTEEERKSFFLKKKKIKEFPCKRSKWKARGGWKAGEGGR